MVVGARLGSPLVLGVGDGECFLASDPSALAGFAQKVVYLDDHQVCVLTADDWHILDRSRRRGAGLGPRPGTWRPRSTTRAASSISCSRRSTSSPRRWRTPCAAGSTRADGTAHFGGLNLDVQRLRQVERIVMTACGTSYHAALVGEYLFEEFARMPVEVEYASEFRYRNPPLDRNTIVMALTQSGETADTLAALRESKRKGHPTLALCNVVGSSIAREADGGVYLHAGPEIGVASTKAFTNQVAVLAMLALLLRPHAASVQPSRGRAWCEELQAMPGPASARRWPARRRVREIAAKYRHVRNVLYLGRQYLFPIALEGALKLKEISYIHAEGYPAAEMKHGPIALVDEQTPTVFLVPRGPVFDKVLSNLEEIKARRGPVIAVVTEGDDETAARADDVIYIPEVPEYLQPLVAVVPLQLLAYHIAVLRGCDVDKPRNLAKSVTVE